MANSTTSMRINDEVKNDAKTILESLGLDLSTFTTMALRQLIFKKAIPFEISLPEYSKETIEAAEEARKIIKDDSVPGYDNADDFMKAMLK